MLKKTSLAPQLKECIMVNHQIKVLQALASAIAEGRGVTGTAFPKQPVRALKLYEFEGSPFCRRVREVITL